MWSMMLAVLMLSSNASAQDFSDIYMIEDSDVSGINFNPLSMHDFNLDGIRDHVSCSREEIVIRDGTDTSKNVYRWTRPYPISNDKGHLWRVSNCEIIEMPGQKIPSIFFSSYWQREDTRRYNSTQHAIVNIDGKFKSKIIGVNQDNSFTPYVAVARNIDCQAYPQKLVDKGYTPGVLCFYAAYQDSLIYSDWRTHTALFKFQIKKGEFSAIDLTPTSDLPWKNGMRGSPKSIFPKQKFCDGNYRYDGIHMMDGALLDFDGDDLVDLISVGQHASTRASRMVYDPIRPEGVRFETENITNPGHCRSGEMADMTEFLTVSAVDKHIKNFKNSCVYITGEYYGSEGTAYGLTARVPDHLRCYTRKKGWIHQSLPGSVVSSAYFGARVQPNGQGELVVFTMDQRDLSQPQKKYYAVDFEGGFAGDVKITKDIERGLIVEGWACRINSDNDIEIRIRGSKEKKNGTYRLLARITPNKLSDTGINPVCMGKRRKAYFKTNIRYDQLPKDIKHLRIRVRDMNDNRSKLLKEYKVE